MRNAFLIIILLITGFMWSDNYQIQLNWDDFEGECSGFISGTIGNQFGFVSGGGAMQALSGKLSSVGEGRSSDAKQVFVINADDGFFTFWLKDKFADEDINNDPELIYKSKPTIKIYKNNTLLNQIKVAEGKGMTCKVFTLDAGDGEIIQENRYYPKARIILGRVVNAKDGKPLENVNISITDYTRQSRLQTTDSTGLYLFEADLGSYTLSFSKPGYIGTEVKTRMGADETPREIVCALSDEIQEYRIVLTWGSRPKDLDAHLSGPNPDGGDFHIWYRNKMLIGGMNFLDRDDMNKYGPETITIYKPAQGDYSYSVFDYSNRSKKRSKKLSRSGAKVQVYGENRLLASFDIPPEQRGNCWHVFKINSNHQIIPVETVEYVEDENNIH